MANKSGYDDGMELLFFYDEDDVATFWLRSRPNQDAIRKGFITLYVQGGLIGLVGLWLLSTYFNHPLVSSIGATLIAGAIIAVLIGFWWIPRSFVKRLRTAARQAGLTFPIHVTLKIGETGLESSMSQRSSTTEYSALTSVAEYPESTYILIGALEGMKINHKKIKSGDLKAFIQELATKNPALVPQKGSAKYNFPMS